MNIRKLKKLRKLLTKFLGELDYTSNDPILIDEAIKIVDEVLVYRIELKNDKKLI
jgi:hypothetical protein